MIDKHILKVKANWWKVLERWPSFGDYTLIVTSRELTVLSREILSKDH